MIEEDFRELQKIGKSLAHIEQQLKYLPEIMAAVFLQMQQQADSHKFYGGKLTDLWDVIPPDKR